MLLKCVHVIKNRPGLPHDERVIEEKKKQKVSSDVIALEVDCVKPDCS